MNIQNHGTPFSATATGGGTAYALVTCKANSIYFVTDASGWTTGIAGTSSVLVTIAGSTSALWNAGGVTYDNHFLTPLRMGAGSTSFGLYMNGATATQANIAGFYITTQ